MSEKRYVIEEQKVVYEGLFNMRELYLFIDSFFKNKGYDKSETKAYEHVTEKGKYIELQYEPYKKINDYVKFIIKIKIKVFDMKDVEVEIDNKKRTMNKGKLNITLRSLIETDYNNQLEQKPFYFVLRVLFDKYLFAGQMSKWQSQLIEESTQFIEQVKGYLNINRFRPM